ncbi:hypothetical protein VTK26DRAFT_9405 [Humicola hyalothermophila]
MAPVKMLLSSAVMLLAAVASARVTMDSVAAPPKGWEQLRTAAADEPIFLRVALKQQGSRALDQAVLDMSTPGHPSYGMHMTRDEVRTYTAPSHVAISATSAWLGDYGIKASVDHDWMSFTTTVGTANKLLDTQFAWYQYSDGGRPKLRTLSYSVPDQVAAHIDLVQPTTRFGRIEARKSAIIETHPLELFDIKANAVDGNTKDSARCNAFVKPECLRNLYRIHYMPSAPNDNKVAFGSFLEQYASYEDLESFQRSYVPDAVGQNFSVEAINGGEPDPNGQHDSMEANLDAQYLFALSYPIPLLEYSTGGRGPLVPTANQPSPPGSNEPYLEWLLYLTSQPNNSALPQTISVSYGEEEQSVPREYALKVCDLFRDLGARGVSVLFASGDSGPGNACISNADNSSTVFEPTFPAGCPWVTAVGGTTGGMAEGNASDEEVAVSFSSGGFSTYHGRPDWQQDVVDKYLAGLGEKHAYAPFFNRSGRGIPDVAAQGSRFIVYNKNIATLIGGTSASCPVVAGAVALLNAARKAQGQPPLGFLNPWLYANAAAFTDVVSGYGVGCVNRPEFGRLGARWNATAGWDPVTGLGTPLFDKLLEAAAPGTKNA